MADYAPVRDQDRGKSPDTDKELLQVIRDRLKYVIDENSQNRAKQKDDLLFSTLEQWPAEIRMAREGDPNGARPCLTIDQINQYIVQVVNDIRQNRPAIKVRPQDDQADVDTAEVFQGVIRQIEDQSLAQVAYGTAAESAVRIGEGYFRIVTEYESETSFNQAIRIKRVPDTFCCYLGPHTMPDGSDAEYGFIFEDMTLDQFRRQYPKARYLSTDFDELQGYRDYWGDQKKVRVAEYFYFDYRPATLCFLADGSTVIKDSKKKYDASMIVEERDTLLKSSKWVKATGVEILERRDWAGKYIPIVKVTGKESYLDGMRITWGLVRPAKDSLRMYNYWASTITEKIALAPKAPFIGAKGQFEGMEDRWGKANVQNFPYLEYNAMSVDGLSVPPPQRQAPVPMEVAMVQQLQTIREDVQASLGQFKASVGKEQPNQSGKAILALTRESDTGTYHFSDNTGISIQYCGRILVDLIPKIHDIESVLKFLGEDGKAQTAAINPQQSESMREIKDAFGKVKRIYNLGVGTYDVTVTVGPSYNTKRMEAATLFTDLANTAKDPTSATVMRYLAIKNSDFPGAEVGAEMMEKLLPPGIVQQEGEPEIPPAVQQKIQMLEQAGQQLLQENQELKAGTQEAQAKIAAQHDAKMKELADERLIELGKLRMQEEIEHRQAELERWKARQKAELDRWVAEQQIEIDRIKAQAMAQAAMAKAENTPASKPN